MDIDFVLFSCQNNERNQLQGTQKKKNSLIQGAGWNSSTLLGTEKPQEGSSVQF